jgi:cytochrome c biogenesis protein ResB
VHPVYRVRVRGNLLVRQARKGNRWGKIVGCVALLLVLLGIVIMIVVTRP